MPKLKFSNPFVKGLSYIICAAIMTGCVSNPAQEVVVNKNDGSFDANVIQTATESVDSDGADTTQMVHYSESFTSTDGTVDFLMNINEYITTVNMSVVEVAPHYLTEEDAKRVANVLFGDAVFYEAEPSFQPVLSKSDIQQQLVRLSPYTNPEKLLEFFEYRPDQPDFQEELAETVKAYIEKLTAMYETAPDGNPHSICEWKFKPDSYYDFPEERVASMDTSKDNEAIVASTSIGDISYLLSFNKRDMNDFKLNYIYAYPYVDSSPLGLDEMIFRASLCRTEKPTDEQINAIKYKAQQMLDSMQLGDWLVDECYLQAVHTGDYVDYRVYVYAVPVFDGIPAIRRPQLTNLHSKEVYASNYYLTDASFQFSVNGDLIYFDMYSTIDVKEILNDNVATLSMDELIERAKDHLSLSDYYEYGLGEELLESIEKDAGEQLICKINICELEYGMVRVKVPDTDDRYYYVPAMMLSGTRDYCGKETGMVFQSIAGDMDLDGISPLIAINAVDGTVIELGNE